MKRIMLALAFLMPATGYGIVDMKNANYVDTWLDLIVPGSGYDLRVQRTYNSRSVFIGMFGFGWCSDFETSIEKTPEGNLKLTECGGGQATLFAPSTTAATKEVDKTISSIIAHVKKTNKAATAEFVKELTEQLQNDSSLRSRWAKAAGLKFDEPKKGVTYSANGREVEKIEYDGKFYVRTTGDGNMQKFDNDGRLAFIYDRNGNFIKLDFKNGLLKEVVDNTGRKLSFDHHQNKKVKQIIGPDGIKVEYKFKSEDLVEVKNAWKNTYGFDYDDTHNLTKVSFPDKTTKLLTYNQKNDWVTSYTDQDKCKETYDYDHKGDPKAHFWATATKTCGKNVVNTARFEFWHKTGSDGRRFLSRVLTKSNNEDLDVTYHPELGRPLTLRKNGQTTTFVYYDNGLIKNKSTAAAKSTYKYHAKFNKVDKVTTEFFDQKGKVRAKRITDFDYDKKANLIFAKNTDGQTVTLTYDVRGRIASITDQAKKEVTIKYEERFGKPSVISRPKVGTINVTYKPNGDIQKVDSKDGPSVAVQVAATFNNLLDIIAPATSELSL